MRSLIAIAALVGVSASADVNLTQINNNEVADATKVMDNFNALASEVNDQDGRIDTVEASVSQLNNGYVPNTTSTYLGTSISISRPILGRGIAVCREAHGANATVLTSEVFYYMAESGTAALASGWGKGDYSTGLERFWGTRSDPNAYISAGMMYFVGGEAYQVNSGSTGINVDQNELPWHCMTKPQ